MKNAAASLPQRLSPLQIALGLSIAVHAVLLTVRFVDPEGFNRVFQDTPLEVILVNAKSTGAPDKAQAIAQSALAGGGDAAQGRATSPLPYSALTAIGEDLEDAQRRMDQMLQQQTQLLAQVRKELAVMPVPDPRAPSDSAQQQTQEQKRLHLQKLLAEIERRINEENARPRKRYVSPATMEGVHAVYYDALRRKVEDKGTQNFPEHGGKKLYGELVMILTVNHDGRVLETEIAQSSGNRHLDRRAEAIARAAGPFGSFGPAMRAQMDQLALVARFKFTREQTLETDLR
ncbi:TonB family protein [Pulveribacter sp.]|uniref:energy transducer TonB n=1 Tax=Pulveribacter sp. TaxID=2678893 RepID=UPI0028B06A2B|nr:TonB family protein [Pulveribacter sp.]